MWNRRRPPLVFGTMVAVLAVTIAACSSGPSTAFNYGGTTVMHVTGQLTGTFQRDTNCIIGSSGPNTIAVSFKTASGHVSGSTSTMTFAMVFNVPMTGGSISFPVSSIMGSVFFENSGGAVAYQWAAGTSFLFKNSAGTLTVANGGTSGSLDVTLQPTSVQPNKAKTSIQVKGSWSNCPSK